MFQAFGVMLRRGVRTKVWSTERIEERIAGELLRFEEWLFHEGGKDALATDDSLNGCYCERKAAIARFLDDKTYMLFLKDFGIDSS